MLLAGSFPLDFLVVCLEVHPDKAESVEEKFSRILIHAHTTPCPDLVSRDMWFLGHATTQWPYFAIAGLKRSTKTDVSPIS